MGPLFRSAEGDSWMRPGAMLADDIADESDLDPNRGRRQNENGSESSAVARRIDVTCKMKKDFINRWKDDCTTL